MIELKDRIYTDCISSGQYNMTTGSAKQGYQNWDVIQDGNTVYYCIIDDTEWEVGHGIKTGVSIQRNVISSSTGEKLELSGSASVFCTYPAEKSVFLDVDGNLPVSKDIIAGGLIESKSLVKAPMIVTDAVLVGGDAEEGNSDITELLNVYTKDEVDKLQEDQDDAWEQSQTQQDVEWTESQEDQDERWGEEQKAQDDKIKENKSSIQGLSSSLEDTNNNVIELEEEIEALAPSYDRGHWAHDPDTEYPNAPLNKHYYVASGVEQTNKFEDVTEIFFSNNDSDDPSNSHTFNDVEVGQMIEIFEGADSSFMLAKITEKTSNADYTVFAVDVIKAEGGVGEVEPEVPDVLATATAGVVRVKFFSLAEGEIDLNGYMQKSGGTFTGDVKIDRGDLHVKATNKGAGISFQVWNADDYQQLLLNGEGNFQYRRPDNITLTTDTVARLSDIDKAISDNSGANGETTLHTLTSAGNTMKYVTPKSLNTGQFASENSNMGSSKTFYFYRLYNAKGETASAKDYEATESTMLEIWVSGELIVKTGLKDWQPSTYSSGDIQASISGYKPVTYGRDLNTSYSYGVLISGLRKK